MKLYHFTSCEQLQQILSDGEIKLTASNLLKPVNMKIINNCLVDETDDYKPVVWFTSCGDFDKAIECGLYDSKTESVIQIETGALGAFYKWDEWAEKNGIEKEWFVALKKTAPLWNTFYVSEAPVKLTSDTRIIFRPDIMDSLQNGT